MSYIEVSVLISSSTVKNVRPCQLYRAQICPCDLNCICHWPLLRRERAKKITRSTHDSRGVFVRYTLQSVLNKRGLMSRYNRPTCITQIPGVVSILRLLSNMTMIRCHPCQSPHQGSHLADLQLERRIALGQKPSSGFRIACRDCAIHFQLVPRVKIFDVPVLLAVLLDLLHRSAKRTLSKLSAFSQTLSGQPTTCRNVGMVSTAVFIYVGRDI